jgi:hypothetical protein
MIKYNERNISNMEVAEDGYWTEVSEVAKLETKKVEVEGRLGKYIDEVVSLDGKLVKARKVIAWYRGIMMFMIIVGVVEAMGAYYG